MYGWMNTVLTDGRMNRLMDKWVDGWKDGTVGE